MGATGELDGRVFGPRAGQLRELVRGLRADVEDLLVDAHRELRVGPAEQVPRAPRRGGT
jgi:hypothetical protein